MKPATIKQIKDELKQRSDEELIDLCLRLARFKKDNKELLTYELFEADDEVEYIKEVKLEITQSLAGINTSTYYWMKKTIRKVLRNTKKYIRYSGKKSTEVELLLFFCEQILLINPSILRNKLLANLYRREIAQIKKQMITLHEDHQYDFKKALEEMPS